MLWQIGCAAFTAQLIDVCLPTGNAKSKFFSPLIYTMNRILVILTIDTENLPSNFTEILQHERAVVAQWKQEGILEHLFLRPTKNGAVLILKDIDEEKANELIKTLPFYAIKKSIDILPLIKDTAI